MMISFSDYQKEMINYAKSITSDNYPGDDYYMLDCWKEYMDDGMTPKEAVDSDMQYWDE